MYYLKNYLIYDTQLFSLMFSTENIFFEELHNVKVLCYILKIILENPSTRQKMFQLV